MNEGGKIPENLPRTLFMINCCVAASQDILRQWATEDLDPDEVRRLSKAAPEYLKSCENELEEIVER